MDVTLTTRGEVSQADRDAAREKIGKLERVVRGPVLDASVVLTQEVNRRLANPARAAGQVRLPRETVRGSASAPTMTEAIDALAELLHRRMRRSVDQHKEVRRRAAEA